MEYVNYHKHSHRSNIRVPDSVTKEIDYIKRAKELGSNIYSTVEHGFQGDIHSVLTLCEKEGMDYIFGSEFYYVDDMLEKDNTNNHVVIIAKNYEGYKEVNEALSIANRDGFYGKPRIDFNVFKNIFNKGNVIVTTACVAGILHNEKLIDFLKDKFKEDFYLEVQTHNNPIQIEHNKEVLRIAKEKGIDIIHANDSHYINEIDKRYREVFLTYKKFPVGDFDLDYPDSDTILERYKRQGVLTEEQALRALKNTLVFKDCTNVAKCINKKIKLPVMSKNPKKELKDIINKEFVNKGFNKLPVEKRKVYLQEVRNEMDTIDKTNMENYFILDYEICKKAIKDYNGVLTKTGRGSAVSFVTNYLLGLTEINRIESPIKLYPTRFMSVERILGASSLPDIDLNTSNAKPFIKASEDVLGKEHCAWMISYKPYQELSAFRMYAKGIGKQQFEVDRVAKDIDSYREHPEWGKIIKESNFYIGVIESVSPSPCSILLYDKGDISKDIGLIRIKDEMCCIIDGYNCDVYKYLKNDYLTTSVWELISNTCDRAGIPIPSIEELEQRLDKNTFDIYEKGYTCTVNQADSDFATNLVMKYKPKTVSEMSAFVARIRPGFKSLLDNFLNRRPYSTGVKELDDILQDSFHYLMYQESIMKYLIWLGIEEGKTYSLIKKIAKKKFTKQELIDLHKILKSNWVEKMSTEEGFEETWKVIEDASKYSFNASHSLSYAYDSLYCAYLKAHYVYEYYTEALEMYNDDLKRTGKLTKELNKQGIEVRDIDFRNASYHYTFNRDEKAIYKGLNSIKFINEEVSLRLEELSKIKGLNFFEVLKELKGYSNKRQIETLIKLGFFKKFGKDKKLLEGYKLYEEFYGKKVFKKDKYKEMLPVIKKYAETETKKQFKDVNTIALINELFDNLDEEELSLRDRIENFYDLTGACNLQDNNSDSRDLFIVDYKVYKRKTWCRCYSPKYAREMVFYIYLNKNDIDVEPVKKFDLIKVVHFERKPKTKLTAEGWRKDKNDLENAIMSYRILERSEGD